ncbi:MAG: IS701 family transposase [Solirubrobacterales bacterium]|nr:IS701 family transposase [Solirubrobacterales bacterium]
MTEDEVRAAADRLVRCHERFAPLFGKEQAQDHASTSVKGLMVCPERKSIEPIALNVGDGQVSALQKFVHSAPWDHEDVQAEVQAVFADELIPTAAGSPIGVVGVVDESGFAKEGPHRAGVARQHHGRLGQEDNGPVGVFLVGVTPGGSALLGHQLDLPEDWCEEGRAGAARREEVHIPEAVAFPTRPQIAAGLIRQTAALGAVSRDGITADEEYGRGGEFLDERERRERRSGVEVPVSTTVWTEDPAGCAPAYGGRGRVPTRPSRAAGASGAAIASGLDRRAGRALQVRQGAKGPLAFAFAWVRVWSVRHRKPGPPVGLLVRRALEPVPEVKYDISTAGAATPLGVPAGVACTRPEVEDHFEDCESYLGMARYETRSRPGWHHHLSLVAMAHLFITLTRRDLGKKRRSGRWTGRCACFRGRSKCPGCR